MGNLLSTPEEVNGDHQGERGRKRKVEDIEENEDKDENEDLLNTPKRKKLKSTSKYIYETLFVEGQSSDVTIVALGRQWHLHRVYLKQSGYFHGMFSGSWKESLEPTIHLDIPDSNITEEALEITFGSLYQDDISITPSQVTGVLAAATLLSQDGLIQQCAEVMKETISSTTVCMYHAASEMYGLTHITRLCVDWLEKNLMTLQTPELLKQLSVRLMREVIHSPDMVVIQVEMDIYTMLKKWVFLKLNPMWSGSTKHLCEDVEQYYKDKKYLSSEGEGDSKSENKFEAYNSVFKGLRLQHIVNDYTSTKVVEDDDIIPKSWLSPVYRQQWLQMLHVEQGIDKGPDDENDANFMPSALRVGRVLPKNSQYCWRWTGYNYGLDLLVSFSNRLITFKRNTHSQQCAGSVSLQSRRQLIYRLSVLSLGGQGETKWTKSTGVKSVSLAKDEEIVVLTVDRSVAFPIHVTANFLMFTPLPEFSCSRDEEGGAPQGGHSQPQQEEAGPSQHHLVGDDDDVS